MSPASLIKVEMRQCVPARASKIVKMLNVIKIINMKIQPSYKLILETFGEMCINLLPYVHFFCN